MGSGGSDWGSSRSSTYDYGSAPSVTRRPARDYAKADKRVYQGSNEGIVKVPKVITTDSSYAAVLIVDVTGSMKDWPGKIFEKMPTLYNEANAVMQKVPLAELKAGKKLENLLDIAVIAVQDVMNATPIQVVDFSQCKKLSDGVNRIAVGGGGGNEVESYDMAIHYVLNHCKLPNVPKGTKVPLIIAGDEGFYEEVDPAEMERWIGDKQVKERDTSKLIKQLCDEYNVYVLRPEPFYDASTYARIHKQWTEAVKNGDERVMRMKTPERLVDCIITLCAHSAKNIDEGVAMLKRRQTEAQVSDVLETLHPLLKGKVTRE